MTLAELADIKQATYQARRAAYTDHVREVIADRRRYEEVWWRTLCGVEIAVRDEGKG